MRLAGPCAAALAVVPPAASLRGATFRVASVLGASLRSASVRGASFRSVSVRALRDGASARGASVRGALRDDVSARGTTRGASLRAASKRLEYDHLYHIGSTVDVFKHCVLMALLRRCTEKASPLTYVETHAGRGLYAFDSEEAATLSEFEDGLYALPRPQSHDGNAATPRPRQSYS